jgi:hypothetical protein
MQLMGVAQPQPQSEEDVRQLREWWLYHASVFLMELMEAAGVPTAPVRVSCGWPSSGGLGKGPHVIGQCFPQQVCADGVSQIFISPRIAESIQVLGTLLHELLHAGVGCESGHHRQFSQPARRLGLTFSARGPISCAIYDKVREVKRSGKLWFEDLWSSNGWDGTGVVWRVEFRFKREFLRELRVDGVYHGIEDATDLPARLVDLWAYAAGHVGGGADGWPDGWLRLVVPVPDDGTRSRWPVHAVWQGVQAAFSTATNRPADFHEVIRKRKQGWNTDRAIESTMGFATSLAAHVGGDLAQPETDFSLFLHWLHEAGSDYLDVKERVFAHEVVRKRVAFGLQAEECSF